MARRRRMPLRNADTAKAPSAVATDTKASPMNAEQVGAGEVRVTENAPEPGVQDTLLESVSADAIVATGAVEPGNSEPGDSEPEAEEPVAEPVSDHAEAGDGASDSEAAPLADDMTVLPEAAAGTVEAAGSAVEAMTGARAMSVAEAAPDLPAAVPNLLAVSDRRIRDPKFPEPRVLGFVKSPRIAEVMGELGEANATVLTYLRGEGIAAMAHWRALSGARTPADAIRIQVDELQRAADASLSCFAALAKRASRFTAVIGKS